MNRAVTLAIPSHKMFVGEDKKARCRRKWWPADLNDVSIRLSAITDT